MSSQQEHQISERVSFYVNKYKMNPHVEGGFYTQIFRHPTQFPMVESEPKNRCLSTSIFYLLANRDFSCFHKIKSYEQWHYYDGNSSLIIHVLDPKTKRYGRFVLNNHVMSPQSVADVNGANDLLTPMCGTIKECEANNTFSDISCFIQPDCWFAAELQDKSEDRFVLSGCTVSFGFDFQDFTTAKRAELLSEYCSGSSFDKDLEDLITRLTRE